MQSDNRFFDDLVKLVNGAAGTFAGVGREAEAGARAKAREWIGGLDFVSRDEFEAVKAMAAAARDEATALRERLDALEGKATRDAIDPAHGAGAGPAIPGVDYP
ncbi:accessory factor UbiK family protein [Sphingomonas solaris]|uniref:Accessory factor UbiK family protein n=1 Tax=Alterirhizorhabdus solaris TaxID=2529389 RepID=A0A558RBR9_9SPHN|nr:accessory factor UbiK family protein [Sphingomonas solaris]TVV76865.1 accessory factor UbiK family protein [Sphingomonas solaris]